LFFPTHAFLVTMGIDVISYRRRVGVFAACMRPRGPRKRCGVYQPESMWDAWTDFSARVLIFTFSLCFWWGIGRCGQMILASNCVLSVSAAMLGRVDVCQPSVFAEATGPTGVPYEVDRTDFLMLCGDVELNPGPIGREDLEQVAASLRETLMQKLDEVATDIKNVRQDISKLSEKLIKVEMDVQAVQKQVDEQEIAIDLVADQQKKTDELVKELADHLEDREIRDRRDNILLHGVPEAENDNLEDCEALFVDTVNAVLPSPLRVDDVVRAHRLGRRAPDKARPLIARVVRSAHKFDILRRRKELRDKGIGVSGDLTQRQRQQLQRARSEGFFAYFKGGVLHTEARHPLPAGGNDRPMTRSYARTAGEKDAAS